MYAAENVCILLCIVAALVIAARKLSIPYPIVLVCAGLVLGFTPGPPIVVRLLPDVFFFSPLASSFQPCSRWVGSRIISFRCCRGPQLSRSGQSSRQLTPLQPRP